MSDPLPCPFCGDSFPEVDLCHDTDALVRCSTCLAEGPVATIGCRDEVSESDLEAEAITLWNQRKLGAVR